VKSRNLIILLAASVLPRTAAANAQTAARNDSLVLEASGVTSEVTLSAFFILAGSDSIILNGRRLQRDQDYAMDYSASRATLAVPLSPDDTLRAYFHRLPLRVSPPVIFLPPAQPPVPGDSAELPAQPWKGSEGPDRTAEGMGAIRLGGNKSLAVAVGTGRDLTIEQALQVSINGKVGQNLDVNAYLSDQEMPLSSTGSTQELDQLDRVYLQARAPEWEVTLGDYDLAMKGFRFAGAERQAQGAEARGHLGRYRASAATAVAKGLKATLRLQGQDGNQGPYLMVPESGAAPILANSERIWLDGELLRRGEAEDYTIDYQQAKLTFTPRRPVTSDSRITAEFQYSRDEFRRTLTVAEAEFQLSSHLSLGIGYLSDGDDPGKPLQQPLDGRQREQLAEAGDDTVRLWVDGGTPSDSGDYDLVDSAYVHVGPGGAYRVAFTWAGTGRGDYLYRPLLGYYEYVGMGNGDYLARLRLPRPEGQRVMALGPRIRWNGGRAEAEGAWSDNDLNLLSDRDDGDNKGVAWCYDMKWSRDTLPWGGFSLSSQAMDVQNSFWTGAAVARPDLRTEWGLGGWSGLRDFDPLAGRRSQQHEFSYWPGRYLKIGGGYGRLRLDDSLGADRVQGWATVSPFPGLTGTYRRQSAELEGPWFLDPGRGGSRRAQELSSNLKVGAYQMEGGAGTSDDIMRSGGGWERGSRDREFWVGMRRSLGRGNAGTSFRRREELARDSGEAEWSGQWYASTWSNDVKLYPWPFLDAGLEHSSRIKRMRPGAAGTGTEAHLGLLRLALRPWRQALVLGSDYSLNLTQTQQKREEYYQVPAGTGQYSFDPATGSFFPDTAGSYLRRVLDEGPAASTVEASLKSSAVIDPSISFPRSWWSRARLELSGQAQIKSFRPVTAKLLGFAPSRLWDRMGNAASQLDMAADVWYRREPWSHHLRLRWRREDDNQYLNRHSTQRRLERMWDASAQADRDTRISLKAEWNETESSTEERGTESRLAPVKLGAEVLRQAGRDLELSARLEGLREKVERTYRSPGDFSVAFSEYTGEAGAARLWGLSGSLRLSAGATRRTADLPQEDITAEYSYTRPLGWTGFWRAQYEYRLNRNITATMVYDGRDEPGRRPRHNGRMELRAYF